MSFRLFTVCAAIGLASSTVAAQEGRSSKQLWALSPKAVARQARRDLEHILIPPTHYPRGYQGILYRSGVHSTSFTTKSHGTSHKGICAREVLALNYAPVDLSKMPETGELRVAPYGIDVRREYHFADRPSKRMRDLDAGAFERECQGLAADKIDWWTAPDDDPLRGVEAWLMLVAAIDAVRGHLVVPDCHDLVSNGTAPHCEDAVVALEDPARLREASTTSVDGHLRYTLFVGAQVVTIDSRRTRYDLLEAPTPADAASFSLSNEEFAVD